MWFKIVSAVVSLTIFLIAPQNGFFVFKTVPMLSINYYNEWASGSNYILMDIRFEWVAWIHNHKGIWYVAANNRVPYTLQLGLVAIRLINESYVDIFCLCTKNERNSLPWTTEKGFTNLYFEQYIWVDVFLPNGVFERRSMDHMEFFMPIPSYRDTISWYLGVQNTNKKLWWSKYIQCIFIGSNKTVYRFS